MKRVKPPYLAQPEDIAYCRKITTKAKAVWAYLRRRERPAMPAFVSYERMASDLDIPKRTVIYCVRMLEGAGRRDGGFLVHKSVGAGRGHVNWYCTHSPEECNLCTFCDEKECGFLRRQKDPGRRRRLDVARGARRGRSRGRK